MDGNLLGVIVGGLIAVISGIAVSLVQHFIASKREDAKDQAADLRALIVAIHELENWSDRHKAKVAFGSEVEPGLSPMAQIEAVVLTRFPYARRELVVLRSAVASYTYWCVERMVERVNSKPLTMGNFNDICREFAQAKAHLTSVVTGTPKVSLPPASVAQTDQPS